MNCFSRYFIFACLLPVCAATAVPKAVEPAPKPVTAIVAETPPVPSAPVDNEITAWVARGRSQYLAGDSAAAAVTFRRVEALDAGNADAGYFLHRIGAEATTAANERARTSAQMLGEVNQAWQRPGVFTRKDAAPAAPAGPSPVLDKLNRIILPSVNFSGMELSRVVNTLSVITEEFDATGATPKGVNIVLLDLGNANPTVNVTLRNLPLKRVLDFITDSVGYQYEVQADAIVVRPGGEQSTLDTQFFPISRSTVLRMTGKAASANAASSDPLKGGPVAAATVTVEGEGKDIRNFLQLAGVIFDDVKGSTLAFDGSQLIVTQTPRNMERIRNILNRYNDVRQVEIEAKFMEVQQGALDELGVQWNIGKKAAQHSGASVSNYLSANRSVADAFTGNSTGTSGAIIRPESSALAADGSVTLSNAINLPVINNAPPIPGTNNLGAAANPLAAVTGIIGEFNVNAVVRALAQKQGTELLSAPKLTVLSGNPATITVAQELRYPQSFGQVQSQVGTGSASGGGSAGVTITAGTPQEFTTRNVGVELKVTPTVEEDDYSISLDLNPKVTEFEGFVEYGGQSVAVSGSTTVTVPSGFFQPIFGVREMNTKVTIWDGATLVMGGLTREDVKSVSDKVPVLGNLPGIGRLFRSNGESTQKRNLLIFVTANLVSPGGSLKKQAMQGAQPGTLYQNPTIVTPAGPASRGR
ncbi:MAG: outD 2 [Lacunisphaera sp.]|nr:outD 2 [Lacunisphaera sp.]